jgi:hypothetical protein
MNAKWIEGLIPGTLKTGSTGNAMFTHRLDAKNFAKIFRFSVTSNL